LAACWNCRGGWEKAGFEWPMTSRSMDEPARVYVGTAIKERNRGDGNCARGLRDSSKGISRLAGNAREWTQLDDRVGCAALIAAANAIGPDLPRRDVTFVWSDSRRNWLGRRRSVRRTRRQRKGVRRISCSRSIRLSAPIRPWSRSALPTQKSGMGFVVRAVDNSNTAPREYVDRVWRWRVSTQSRCNMERPAAGTMALFSVRYGSVDVAMGLAAALRALAGRSD